MKPSALRILDYLRDRGGFVPAIDLADLPCLDYRKRISELRRSGCVIVSRPVKDRPYYEYILIKEGP